MPRVTIQFKGTPALPRLQGYAGAVALNLKNGSTKRLEASYAARMVERFPDNITIVEEHPTQGEAKTSPPPPPVVPIKTPQPTSNGQTEEPVGETPAEEEATALVPDGQCHGTTKAGRRCRTKVGPGVLYCGNHQPL